MTRRLLYPILLLYLFSFTGINAAAQSTDSVLVLDDVIQRVLSANPDLQSTYEQWQASTKRISQMKALPDPTLGLNMMNLPVNSFALDQEPMTGKQISLMQPIPFPGKLELKGKIAESESEIVRQQHLERKNQLIKQAKLWYYELYYIDRALETVRDNLLLIEDFTEIAETRYSVGQGLQQDVLRAQVAQSKMLDRETTLQEKRQSLRAKLNFLLNQPSDTPLGTPVLPTSASWDGSLERLMTQAEAQNPMLTAWKSVLTKSDQAVELSQKDRYPDFAVGMAYTQRQELQNGMKGYDLLSAMVNIRLPIYRKQKQDQKVEQTKLQQNAARYGYADVQNAISRKLEEALAELRKGQKLLDLYESGIIPQAEESMESSLAGYQNDQVDFLSLLDSELTLFNFQLDYHRYLADYHQAMAKLTALTGSEIQK
jgi:cobalt-zinc-cadmium efflux system outer membrane protein